MVSLWPWKGEDTSPASFEKTLAALAQKITRLQTQQDGLRQRNRRYKALWTLYTSFAYLLCVVVAFLAVGGQNLDGLQYGLIAATPVVIFGVRKGIAGYYTHRLSKVAARLDHENQVRQKTIDKLKAATRYDSTQSLLEKYGGVAPSKGSGNAGLPKDMSGPSPSPSGKASKRPQRTGIGPPATANIRPSHDSLADHASISSGNTPARIASSSHPGSPDQVVAGASFAPNAFDDVIEGPPSPGKSSPQAFHNHLAPPAPHLPTAIPPTTIHWYDRVLDLLMGEDETSARNRLALICTSCRLVNGLAPPGAKSLLAVGRWRCSSCQAWNGVETEEKLSSVDDEGAVASYHRGSGTERQEPEDKRVVGGPEYQAISLNARHEEKMEPASDEHPSPDEEFSRSDEEVAETFNSDHKEAQAQDDDILIDDKRRNSSTVRQRKGRKT